MDNIWPIWHVQAVSRVHRELVPSSEEPGDNGDHPKYILNFRGTTGHPKWNQWTTTGVTTDDAAATKKSAKSLLDHLASQMGHTVSQRCRIYKLGDV